MGLKAAGASQDEPTPRERQKGPLLDLVAQAQSTPPEELVSEQGPQWSRDGRGQGAAGCKRKGLPWERSIRNKGSRCCDGEEGRERDSGMIRSHFANSLE